MRFLLTLCLLLLPLISNASNAGIVRGLWYDQESFFVGDAVRVYVAVRNNTGSDLSGTVEFFVNGSRIERNNIDALDGRIVESWADWNPSFGTNTVMATLSRTELSSSALGTQAVTVTSALAEETLFIDYDTDQDGTGNTQDLDDDNDGQSDEIEQYHGTDSLVFTETKVSTGTAPERSERGDETTALSSIDNGTSVGLEQYLTPSRADTLLTSVTKTVSRAKEKIDEYRVARQTSMAEARATTSETIIVNEDGFGGIARNSDAEPIAKKSYGFFGDTVTFLTNLSSALYTKLLSSLSWLFGNPMLIQLLLLIGIIVSIIKTAQHLSRRPS